MRIINSIQIPEVFTANIKFSASQLVNDDSIMTVKAVNRYNGETLYGTGTNGSASIIIKEPGIYDVIGKIHDTGFSFPNEIVCADIGRSYNSSLRFIILNVSIPTGSTITTTLEDYTITRTSVDNKCTLYFPPFRGPWTLHATDGSQNTYQVIEFQYVQTYDITMTYGDNNAGYRGENLLTTSHFSNIDNLYNAVKSGNFSDIWVGDYVIYDNIKYLVMGVDFYKGKGIVEGDAHHLVIVPEHMFGEARMNSSDTNETGYANSEMHTITLPNTYLPIMNAALGNHILNGTWTLTTDNNDTTAKRTCKIRLLNEMAVFGKVERGKVSDNGEMDTILPGFELNTNLRTKKNGPSSGWWLSSVNDSSSSDFCEVYWAGDVSQSGASQNDGVAPMVLFG